MYEEKCWCIAMNWRDIEDLCVVLFWFWEALQHNKLIIIIIIIIDTSFEK